MPPPLEGDSTNAATPGVKGTNSATGNGVLGTSAGSDAIVGIGQAQGKAGVLGLAPNGIAVVGISDPVNGNGQGVFGQGKLFGGNFTSPQVGVVAAGGSGNAVSGTSTESDAVVGIGQAQGKAGVLGLAPNGIAVVGISDPVNGNGQGVFGQGKLFGGNFTSPQIGVVAAGGSGNAVSGTSTESDAVVGTAQAQGKAGVLGLAPNGNAVVGISSAGSLNGVLGINNAPGGVVTDDANGVLGTCGIAGNAIHGIGGTNAGLFDGHVQINGGLDVTGELTVLGAKHFRIDHPCDPANKYLLHCSVEAPELINVYSGNVITGEATTATVLLPNYFEDLNYDFRYQLTAIGQFCQAIVAEEIANNRFVIKTDKPHVKVSWQVSGVRKDAYAKANPLVVEKEKSAEEKASYLRPQLYSHPADKAPHPPGARALT